MAEKGTVPDAMSILRMSGVITSIARFLHAYASVRDIPPHRLFAFVWDDCIQHFAVPSCGVRRKGVGALDLLEPPLTGPRVHAHTPRVLPHALCDVLPEHGSLLRDEDGGGHQTHHPLLERGHAGGPRGCACGTVVVCDLMLREKCRHERLPCARV